MGTMIHGLYGRDGRKFVSVDDLISHLRETKMTWMDLVDKPGKDKDKQTLYKAIAKAKANMCNDIIKDLETLALTSN